MTDIKQNIKTRIKKLNLKKINIFIFGSCANNTDHDTSDIDIGIQGEGEIPSKQYYMIKDALEEIETLRKFDLVDFALVSKKFKQQALKNTYSLN